MNTTANHPVTEQAYFVPCASQGCVAKIPASKVADWDGKCPKCTGTVTYKTRSTRNAFVPCKDCGVQLHKGYVQSHGNQCPKCRQQTPVRPERVIKLCNVCNHNQVYSTDVCRPCTEKEVNPSDIGIYHHTDGSVTVSESLVDNYGHTNDVTKFQYDLRKKQGFFIALKDNTRQAVEGYIRRTETKYGYMYFGIHQLDKEKWQVTELMTGCKLFNETSKAMAVAEIEHFIDINGEKLDKAITQTINQRIKDRKQGRSEAV